MKNKLIISLTMICLMCSLAIAGGFDVSYSTDDIWVRGSSSDDTEMTFFICPNEWSQFHVKLFEGGVAISDQSAISFVGDDCVEVATSTTFPLTTLEEDTQYCMTARGYNSKTHAYSYEYTGCGSTAPVGEECSLTQTCLGTRCTITKGTCFSDYTTIDIDVYDIYENKVKDYTPRAFLSSMAYEVPEYNKNYLVRFKLSTVALDNLFLYDYLEVGSCNDNRFELGLGVGKTSVDVNVVGSVSEYTSFSWGVEKLFGDTYQPIVNGESTSKDFTVSDLDSSTQYRIAVRGNNPCESGYLHYRNFITKTGDTLIQNWTISLDTGITTANISVAQGDIGTGYQFKLYESDGDLISFNETAVPYINYTELSQGTEYLISVGVDFDDGTVYHSQFFSLDLNTSNYFLGTTPSEELSYCSFIDIWFYNSSDGEIDFPFPDGSLTLNLTAVNGTDVVEQIIGLYGGFNRQSIPFNNLTPSSEYDLNATITIDSNEQMFFNSTETIITESVNTSQPLNFYYEITEDSFNDFRAGLRGDIDVDCQVYLDQCGKIHATNFEIQLWDNTTDVPLMIGTGYNFNSTFNITNLLFDHDYFISIILPKINNDTFESYNYSLVPTTLDSVICDGVKYIKSFGADFSFTEENVNVQTSLFDKHNNYGSIETEWRIFVMRPNKEIVSQKTFFSTYISPYQEIGAYDSEEETVEIAVFRDISCDITPYQKQTLTHRQDYTIQLDTDIIKKFGFFQPLYNTFDDLFPSTTAKFFAVMFVAVILGAVAWIFSVVNGVPFGWAIGLIPVVLGLILLYSINSLPVALTFIFGIVVALVLFMIALKSMG